MKKVNRKQLHETIGAFIDRSLDMTQLVSALIVLGKDSIGKTSIMMEEAEFRQQGPKADINLDTKAGKGKFCMVEYPSFVWVKTEYYDDTNDLRKILEYVLMNVSAPMLSGRKEQKSVLFEIDCHRKDIEDISQSFGMLPVVYYHLTSEDFTEWATSINPKTGCANIDPAILPLALSSFEQQQDQEDIDGNDDIFERELTAEEIFDDMDEFFSDPVTFRDSITPALSAFLKKTETGFIDKYNDEVWKRISDRWQEIAHELSLDIVSFQPNGTTYNRFLKKRGCCVFSDEEGWKDWYKRQIFTPMKRIQKHNNCDNLPELPVKKVSAFPSVEDRIAIVKEQLIMAAIEETQKTRCNADTIKDALFKYFNISLYTVFES